MYMATETRPDVDKTIKVFDLNLELQNNLLSVPILEIKTKIYN